MADDFNSWETSSGLLDEITGEIVDATFGYKESYQSGEALLLIADVQTGDPELGEGGILTLDWPVGKGWETGDKGKTATHESGKPKKFNGQSGIGVLIDSIRDAGGLAAMAKKGEAFEAASYVGLNATFTRKEYKNTINGEERSWNRMLVSEIHDGKAKAQAPKPDPEPVAEATDTPAEAASTPKVPAALKIKLKKLAIECDDHDTFVERAFAEIDGVDGVQNVEDAVSDEDFYRGLKG